jgi:transposase
MPSPLIDVFSFIPRLLLANMTPPLSHTMRETITLRFVRGDANKVISEVTGVSLRQVQQMKRNWTHFGEVIAPQLTIGHRPRKLNGFHELELLKYLEQRPHAYIDEMCWFLWDEFEISVSEVTVGRALKRLGWNRKKVIKRSGQRNQALRDGWMHRLGGWTAEQLVFLDESAACERTGNISRFMPSINASDQCSLVIAF